MCSQADAPIYGEVDDPLYGEVDDPNEPEAVVAAPAVVPVDIHQVRVLASRSLNRAGQMWTSLTKQLVLSPKSSCARRRPPRRCAPSCVLTPGLGGVPEAQRPETQVGRRAASAGGVVLGLFTDSKFFDTPAIERGLVDHECIFPIQVCDRGLGRRGRR